MNLESLLVMFQGSSTLLKPETLIVFLYLNCLKQKLIQDNGDPSCGSPKGLGLIPNHNAVTYVAKTCGAFFLFKAVPVVKCLLWIQLLFSYKAALIFLL